MSSKIPCPIYQKCGTQIRSRFTDINELSRVLGVGVYDALIGMHSFTGYDTVSAFNGRGKSATFKKLKTDKTYQATFKELGSSWEISDDLF